MFGIIKKCIYETRLVINADRINAHYLNIPAKKNRVNIYEYHPELLGLDLHYNNPYNLGDTLGMVIIKYLLDKRGVDIDKNISKTRHLNCVGSNILCSYQNATIWGSGIMHNPTKRNIFFTKLSGRKLDIRAVRGPLTRKAIYSLGYTCPEIYGDPAILMPFIYNPIIEKKYKYSIIPQFAVEKYFRTNYNFENVISMNTNDYMKVIDEIKSSEIIYTSSLHGIILAESYGIPAVFFRGLDKSIDFKYLDYYYSTNRLGIKIYDSIEDALNADISLEIPNLSKLQQDLLDSFPYDLWEI